MKKTKITLRDFQDQREFFYSKYIWKELTNIIQTLRNYNTLTALKKVSKTNLLDTVQLSLECYMY